MSSTERDRLVAAFRRRPFDPDLPVAAMRERLDGFARLYPVPAGVDVETGALAGRPVETLRAGDGPAALFLHGGGFVVGSPASHRHLATRLAVEIAGTVTVLDYRLSPEHPFPAAQDDCVAAYAALTARADARPVAIVGDSAGGNLAFSTAIAARDRGLPSPPALVALSPWINLGSEHESFDLIGPSDPTLSRAVADWYAERHLGVALASDPRASPLFADLAGLPRTLIQVGDREVFMGDAVRLHQRLIAAGVDAELTVAPGMFHVWHLHWPDLEEARDAIRAAARFLLAS